jgi:hypothetical protein
MPGEIIIGDLPGLSRLTYERRLRPAGTEFTSVVLSSQDYYPSINLRDRASERWPVAVDRCQELGLQLKAAPEVPASRWLAEGRREAALAEFFAAALCNATNWDLLRTGIADRARHTATFNVRALRDLDEASFVSQYGAAFERPGDLSRRYQALIAVTSALAEGEILDLERLLESPVQLAGPGGLYDKLARMPAFMDDPGQKKTRVLVQELCRTRLISPVDPQSVRPAVEYHLIRLYLRTSRVSASRRADQDRLSSGAEFPLPVITELRRAVEAAMYCTAEAAGIPVYDLNTIEWQIGRSFCIRSGPRCVGPSLPNKPCGTAVTALVERNQGRCPFAGCCNGVHDAALASLVEPQLAPQYDFY